MVEHDNSFSLDDEGGDTTSQTNTQNAGAASLSQLQQQLAAQSEMMATLMARLELADAERAKAEKTATDTEVELKKLRKSRRSVSIGGMMGSRAAKREIKINGGDSRHLYFKVRTAYHMATDRLTKKNLERELEELTWSEDL